VCSSDLDLSEGVDCAQQRFARLNQRFIQRVYFFALGAQTRITEQQNALCEIIVFGHAGPSVTKISGRSLAEISAFFKAAKPAAPDAVVAIPADRSSSLAVSASVSRTFT